MQKLRSGETRLEPARVATQRFRLANRASPLPNGEHNVSAGLSGIDFIVAGEFLERAGFENLDLLLCVCKLRLAELEQFGAAFVGAERVLERKLSAFHASNDVFELD